MNRVIWCSPGCTGTEIGIGSQNPTLVYSKSAARVLLVAPLNRSSSPVLVRRRRLPSAAG
ncbi:hypothetical protein E1267_20605 [Nonomuraea longispora]|uniref:Uncharacterized protein n=1 Tax=Nonomuraea longispora TaxID=1848320 RepID=A0A4R4NA84_9ACTN|nr:hypothetical protein [Nonomuraea longispora]TDC05074.1 hypothetical protein E1267_20605 [Nonomuraea longispora]